MRVLLTGGSSFTGFWFAAALARQGHHVVAPLRAEAAAYSEGPRGERVTRLKKIAEGVDQAPFGSQRFIEVAAAGFDVLCHHAARVGNYRNPDFDVAGAVAENTHELRAVLKAMTARGELKAVLATGSVFEQDEGVGNPPLMAFSPYGLSKGLSAKVIAYRAHEAGVRFGKFVIPNPFGPLEEPRFCAYLVRTWKSGAAARVNTPAYVRDNIHVDLLAAAYARYVAELVSGNAPCKLNPSGYVENQGRFAERYAAAVRERTGLECGLDLARQTDFEEPLMRVNTDPAQLYLPEWSEVAAWDAAVAAYFG